MFYELCFSVGLVTRNMAGKSRLRLKEQLVLCERRTAQSGFDMGTRRQALLGMK